MAGAVWVTYTGGNIAGQNIWATIDEQLHDHSPELGEILKQLVKDKTPVDTGALESSIDFDAYTSTGDADLVWVYADEGPQIATWNRVYVEYQEGPPMGLSTYTNNPRLMFMITSETDGQDATLVWAMQWVNYAITLCLSGAGIPI